MIHGDAIVNRSATEAMEQDWDIGRQQADQYDDGKNREY